MSSSSLVVLNHGRDVSELRRSSRRLFDLFVFWRSERMELNIIKTGARRALWCAIGAVVLCAASAFAQTTGRLVGSIVDAQGAVLPGVTVTVTSPQLQGANTQITDASGQFRFPSLPPGTYNVK